MPDREAYREALRWRYFSWLPYQEDSELPLKFFQQTIGGSGPGSGFHNTNLDYSGSFPNDFSLEALWFKVRGPFCAQLRLDQLFAWLDQGHYDLRIGQRRYFEGMPALEPDHFQPPLQIARGHYIILELTWPEPPRWAKRLNAADPNDFQIGAVLEGLKLRDLV